MPDGVKELSIHALANCYYIPEIILPESLETIGEEAFEDCDKLTEITIPAGVITIDSNPFYSCNKLKEIRVDENNQDFCGENGVLFDKNKTRLIQYPAEKDNIEYSVPDTVSEISEYAFLYNKYLTYITMPDNVTSIGKYAFSSCTSLTSITIPKNITSIDFYTFNGCTALTDVYYSGSETEWKNIDIDEYGNDALKNARIHYNYVRTDPDTYVISNIQAASGGVELTVKSNKSVSGEQVVIVAYYDAGGAFLNCETQPITYSETEQTISFNGNENAASVKAFIWNVLDGMMPASAAAEIAINQ